MDIAWYYSYYIPTTTQFLTSQSQFKTIQEGMPSDREVLECISNFVIKHMWDIVFQGLVGQSSLTSQMRVIPHPSHEYNNVAVADTAYAKNSVSDFLKTQGIIAKETTEEITAQFRSWYKSFSDNVTDIYRSFILAAPSDAQVIPVSFPVGIKNAIKAVAKLYAQEYISCKIDVENYSDVELTWVDNSSANTVICANLVERGIFAEPYSESGFQMSATLGTGYSALFPSEQESFNLMMIKNVVTGLSIPFAYSCYKEVSGVRTPIHFDSFEAISGYDTYNQKMYFTIYGYVNSSDFTQDNCTLVKYNRNYKRNAHEHPQGFPTADQEIYVSLPYIDSYYYTSSNFFTKGSLFNAADTQYNFHPSSEYGEYLGTLYVDVDNGYFSGMTEEQLYDEENYLLDVYIRNNISIIDETYEFPITQDPAIKQKLISDEYDVIGSGNSVDAGTRSGEGVTVVVDPATIGTLTEVYPATDVIAEAVNVYPVDLAEDKVIADNPAEAISIADAAIAVDVANEQSGVAVGITPVELVSATGRYGMFTLYKVTISQLTALSSKLWSQDFFDNFHPFTNNPSEALISLMAYPMDINSSGSDSAIICGNYDCSPASGKVVTNLFNTKTLGSVTIPENFGNFLDYSPYTKVNLFLPFIGFVELDVDEVMGATISVFYRVEVITGTCVACVKVKKGTMDAILYQYAGNMGITLPLSGSDFSRTYSLLVTAGAEVLGGLVTGTGVSIAAAAAFGGQAVAAKPPVHKTGGLGGNSGMCGNLAPYVVINTVIPDTPDGYKALKGKPTNKYLRVGDLQGFVQLDKFYLNIPDITDEERLELDSLLKEGIFV